MLYSGGSNLSQAYDVIQELFKSKQESRMLEQFYADFNKLSEDQGDFSYHNSCEGDAREVKQIDGPYFLRSTASRVFEGSIKCD